MTHVLELDRIKNELSLFLLFENFTFVMKKFKTIDHTIFQPK
jgi:hypothetical protein